MSQATALPPIIGTPVLRPGELNSDARVRIAAMEAEARERRRLELLEQIAIQHTPTQRIQIWERLHELSLPKKPLHPLVRIIARQTELTIEDILDEQRRRRAPATVAPTT